MSDLRERLTFRRELPRHLRELGLLIGRPVGETELLSLKETKEVLARFKQLDRQPRMDFEIPFDEKSEPRFRVFLGRLAEAHPGDVYFWTPASTLCGLLPPLPLSTLRIDFPFDLSPDGIVHVITSELCDDLVLDYSLGDHDEQLLEVTVSGKHWGSIAY